MRLTLKIILVSALVLNFAAACANAQTLQQLSEDITRIVQNAAPSVVTIHAQRSVERPQPETMKMLLSNIFNTSGTGLVVDSNGYILTSCNVVSNAKNVEVTFSDGSSVDGIVTGTDSLTNTAMVKIQKTGLRALELGDSNELQPGTLVISINNRSGLTNTISLGVVSGAKGGFDGLATDLIQVSGDVGPGASGGPVLDPSGRVVAMTTAMLAFPAELPLLNKSGSIDQSKDSGGASSVEIDAAPGIVGTGTVKTGSTLNGADVTTKITHFSTGNGQALKILAGINNQALEAASLGGNTGFAVPINNIKPILDNLKSGKEVDRGFLDMVVNEKNGQIVLNPRPNGAAEKAGVRAGDILISANGITFETVRQFANYVSNLKPGDKVQMRIQRDGKEMEITAIASKRSNSSVDLSAFPGIALNIPAIPGVASPKISVGSVISLNLSDADIEEAAKAISQAFGKSVVVNNPKKIKRKSTVQSKSTAIEGALDIICRAMDCTYKKNGDTYVISPK